MLTVNQVAHYLSPSFKDKSEGFSFLEDLLPACFRVKSSVPLLTIVNCLGELFSAVGDYLLLRGLWGYFRATHGPENPVLLDLESCRNFCLFMSCDLYKFVGFVEYAISSWFSVSAWDYGCLRRWCSLLRGFMYAVCLDSFFWPIQCSLRRSF